MDIMETTVPGERPQDFVQLTDSRGETHVFSRFPLSARMAPMVATFALARQLPDSLGPSIVYVRTTPNLREELEDPLLQTLARAHGATHVLVHCRSLNGASVAGLEASLVEAFRPVMNAGHAVAAPQLLAEPTGRPLATVARH